MDVTSTHPRARRSGIGAAAAGLTVVAALLAGCASSDSTGGSSASSASATTTAGNPNQAVAQQLPPNAVDDAVGQLDGLVSEMMATTKIPGMAVAVVEGDTVKYAKGFGVTDVTTGAKVNADTVFPLASMSKPIGSTVLTKLITDGRITWSTPVAAGLPGFVLADPYVTRTVTVGDMYAHRSGLPDHAGDKLEDLGYDRATILQRLRYVPLQPFRITYDYTNFGVTAAAESVAHGAGTDWETLSATTLYGPLGMTRTSSRFADFEARSNRVVGHVMVDGKWVKTPAQRDPDAQSPAGGVSSSVNDIARWLEMLLADGKVGGKQFISPDALTPAVTPQIVSAPSAEPADRAGFYGYGFNAGVGSGGRTRYGHAGAFAMGAGTNFLVLPSANVAIVALSNAAPIGAVDALCAEFLDIVEFGKVREAWRDLYATAYASISKPEGSLVGKHAPANPAPAQPLSTYAGTYGNAYYGPATVRESGGKLVLAMGPDGQTTRELTHWDGNTFTFTLSNENAAPGSVSKVTFDGPRMTIECYADDINDGVFVRQ